MERTYTLAQAKKEMKELTSDVISFDSLTLEFDATRDRDSEGNEIIDLNMNGGYKGNMIDSITIETYQPNEVAKLEKRIAKLRETYSVIKDY